MALGAQELFSLFHPFAAYKTENYRRSGQRFVHYASADTGLKILRSREVWLRNTNLMNDFSEVVHGQNCIQSAWNDEYLGGRLRHLLNKVSPGFSERFQHEFNSHQFSRHTQSYMICVSEHGDENTDGVDEDKYGRLSMWRAYGGDKNIALVLKPEPFFGEENNIGAFGSPVLYADEAAFQRQFDTLVSALEEQKDEILECEPEDLYRQLFSAFHTAVLSTKHPGFAEEREWRVIFSPTIYSSEVLQKSVEVVSGAPQIVYRLPLRNDQGKGISGLDIFDLLDRIIIGPTANPLPIADAFAEVLSDLGFDKPYEKLVISNIPLRR